MDGEIFFNMFREPHPIYGKSEFLLKRWQKYTIYVKSGSYVKSDNPSEVSIHSSSLRTNRYGGQYSVPDSPKANVYATSSIYLYDYVIVSDKWFLSSVYTASTVDNTPALDERYDSNTGLWSHSINTWRNSPNARENNFIWRPNEPATTFATHRVSGSLPGYYPNPVPSPYTFMTTDQYLTFMNTPIYRDDGTYFEIVRGYPRNHYTHKRGYFAPERFTSYGLIGNQVTSASYRKGQQTNGTTIGPSGLSDGSDPVQTTQVTNIDLVKSDNVIYH